MALRSGETLRLSHTVDTGIPWINVESWRIKNAAVVYATSAAPNGWTVTLVSGSWGNSNAVVDVTAPATFIGSTEYHELYYFQHSDGGNEFIESFVVSFDSLVAPNPARCAFAFQGRQVYLAKNETDGVQIYAGTIDAVPSQARGLVPDVYTGLDYLWVDDIGRVWLFAIAIDSTGRGILNTDQHIFISSDGGRSWSEIGTVPFVFAWVGRGPSTELLARGNVSNKLNVSYDEGATWNERALFGSPWWVRQGTQLHNGSSLTDDMGRSVTDFILTPSGTSRVRPGLNGMVMGIGLSGGNLRFRKNNGQTGPTSASLWTTAVDVAPATHTSWTLYQYLDGLIYLFSMTARRVSADGGQTWV